VGGKPGPGIRILNGEIPVGTISDSKIKGFQGFWGGLVRLCYRPGGKNLQPRFLGGGGGGGGGTEFLRLGAIIGP